ncbi:hypothetical protein TNCV_3279671 [Trichonephila clavipes]|nr:hypothetical protein TNCV_3279671 [Trichonephila clavipes]
MGTGKHFTPFTELSLGLDFGGPPYFRISVSFTWNWSPPLLPPTELPHPRAESDLRVSLVDNGLVGPYTATVLVPLSSAPNHRPPRLASAR